ncbi:MAG TPA: c-type cytochrome [Caldimonas sp.]|nr:c-type cytochrome [Caldimonas sp.]
MHPAITWGRVPAWRAVGALLAFALADVAALAQPSDRQGNEVVDAVCGQCHLTGKDKAPRIGDAAAWAPRASQGLTSLTESAIKGIRNMPAHGGSPNVSDVEIERAIVYMVNRSGGHWVEPVRGSVVARTSQAIVDTQCASCHQAGLNGAPKIGDRAAWIPRLKNGIDPLVASAVHGHGGMPARGGMPDLDRQDIRDAILYMFTYGLPPSPPVVAAAPPDPRHRLVSGTDVYLGMVRAEALRASQASPITLDEIPSGGGYYHVNVTLYDNRSQEPVTDAAVKMRVTDGMSAESKALKAEARNRPVSYGSFFHMSSGSAYWITAEIRRPGVPHPIEAKFEVKAP